VEEGLNAMIRNRMIAGVIIEQVDDRTETGVVKIYTEGTDGITETRHLIRIVDEKVVYKKIV
jgi:hypothetical protein